jgi:hypothetical protein
MSLTKRELYETTVYVQKKEIERLNSVLREIAFNPGCRQLYMTAPMDRENTPPTVAAFALKGMTK